LRDECLRAIPKLLETSTDGDSLRADRRNLRRLRAAPLRVAAAGVPDRIGGAGPVVMANKERAAAQ